MSTNKKKAISPSYFLPLGTLCLCFCYSLESTTPNAAIRDDSCIITLFFPNNKNFPSFARCHRPPSENEARKNRVVCEKEHAHSPPHINRSHSHSHISARQCASLNRFSGDLSCPLSVLHEAAMERSRRVLPIRSRGALFRAHSGFTTTLQKCIADGKKYETFPHAVEHPYPTSPLTLSSSS